MSFLREDPSRPFAQAGVVADPPVGPVDRLDAGGARGEHGHLFRHEEPLGIGQDPGGQCEILGAEIEAAEPRMSAGDVGNAEERRRGLDHRNEAGRPRRHAALGFDLVDDFGEQPHMLWAINFGQGERQDTGRK